MTEVDTEFDNIDDDCGEPVDECVCDAVDGDEDFDDDDEEE